MKLIISLLIGLVGFAQAAITATNYNDSIGDIDPGISTGGGTLDIVGMEVSNTATDINFKLTVNGNLATTDWGKFMIGIATGKTDGTLTGNGWGRPISLSYDNDPFAAQIVGMNYWIGSWVDAGGGSNFQSYNNTSSSWSAPTSLASFSVTSGATSDILYSVSLTSLGLTAGDSFYFDAYSSGGGGADSAIDSLANPNVTISSWGDSYTSYATAALGPGLNSYTITAIPEPSASLLLVLGAAGLLRRRR
jgi:hypothetical protein